MTTFTIVKNGKGFHFGEFKTQNGVANEYVESLNPLKMWRDEIVGIKIRGGIKNHQLAKRITAKLNKEWAKTHFLIWRSQNLGEGLVDFGIVSVGDFRDPDFGWNDDIHWNTWDLDLPPMSREEALKKIKELEANET